MLSIDILAVIPALLDGPFAHSMLKRAQDRGLLRVRIFDLREWGLGKHKQLDDYQYGGGAGLVMMPEPLHQAIAELDREAKYDEVIFMTPDGTPFDQAAANQLSLRQNILLICGHYKGIDQRIRDHLITREISIGDYVLSGGELAAAVVVDAVGRLLPGVLNDETSALEDSFQNELLSHPVYTRPAEYNGWHVPDVLLSGHEKKISDWREEKALQRTREIRPDLLDE